MVFDADPDHIATLDSTTLVKLLKRLALSESRLVGIPLRGASVPLQITVADDGEDGRVEWDGGVESTAYFPSRYTAFQSKAQDLTVSRIKGEVLKTPKKGPAKLNPTVVEVLSRGGAYIIFCREPMVTKKRKALVRAMCEAIVAGGGDPKNAALLDVYDANLIADWVNTHPPVALWLASLKHGRNLSGFQSHEEWGKNPDFSTYWQPSDEPRFVPINRNVPDGDRKNKGLSAWTFSQAADEILRFLASEGSIVRIFGPSGFGKSRFVFETLRLQRTTSDEIDAAAVVFCDGSILKDDASKLALDLAVNRSAALLVIDECDDELHLKISNVVRRSGSKLRLLTIDIETKVLQAQDTLSVRIEKADKTLIQDIAASVAPELDDRDKNFIADLADGFPRMAVLAAQQGVDGHQTFLSVEQILERILWSGKQRVAEAQRALEVASLFEWFGVQGRVESQAACIASNLAGMPLPMFVEHLLSFKSRGIITQRGDFLQIGPVPLAARLGLARLAVTTPEQTFAFFQHAPDELQFSMLKRLKWLDTSPVVRSLAERLLHPDMIGNLTALNTESGSKMLDRLVHLAPDIASDAIEMVFGELSQEDLILIQDGRRYLVWSLEKLVFRKETFDRSARLLLRLASAETENSSNNATGQFKQLFQLYLSGTEADPSARLRVLDAALASGDIKQRTICVEALGRMLDSNHFSRGGGAEQIGSNEALEDWRPGTYGEIWAFFRSAICRLLPIAASDDELAPVARSHLATHLRSLFDTLPVAEIRSMIQRVMAHIGPWPAAITGVSQFLYFDRDKGTPPERSEEIRRLYDEILPVDPIDLAELYTDGWQLDLHDPDSRYDPNPKEPESFDFGERRSVAIAVDIAKSMELSVRAIERMACGSGNTTYPFAVALMKSTQAPVEIFAKAVEVAEKSGKSPNRGFFAGLISGADQRSPDLAKSFVRVALKSAKLKDQIVALIGSGSFSDEDIALIVALVASGDVKPWQIENLGLARLTVAQMMVLLQEVKKHGNDGLWTVIDSVGMYLHRDKSEDCSELLDLVKTVLLDPELLQAARSTMDGYHMEQLASRLIQMDAVDEPYAAKLAKQLMTICREGGGGPFHQLDQPVRKILGALMAVYPTVTWAEIARKLESESWHDRFYAENLLEARNFDDHLGRGLAIPIGADVYLAWVRNDPEKRAHRAIAWLPIANRADDGSLVWHVELSEFINEFADKPDVLNELGQRLSPSSYWGSLDRYLEPIVPLVDTWAQHPSPAVRKWVPDVLRWLRKTIENERKRSEEHVVRYS